MDAYIEPFTKLTVYILYIEYFTKLLCEHTEHFTNSFSWKASHFKRSYIDTFYYWCYFTAPILKTTFVHQIVVYTGAHALSPKLNAMCSLSPLQNYIVYTAEAHWALYKTHSATHVGALTPVSTMYNAHCTKYIVHIHTPDPCLNPCLGSLGKTGCKEYCCWWFRI